jgi:peptidoglycan biosynthesis protein MviN/MurJ (putative lipid II flippase)
MAGALAVTLNGVLDWLLVGPLGLLGLGLSTAIVHAGIGGTLLITAVPERRIFSQGLISFGTRVCIANATALGSSIAILAALGESAAGIAVAAGAGLATLVLVARAVNLPEYPLLVRSLKDRAPRSASTTP